MKFYTTTKPVSKLSADALVLFVRDGDDLKKIDMLLEEEGFKAGLGEIFIVQKPKLLSYKKLFVVGLGKEKELSAYGWQYVHAAIARRAKSARISSLVIPTSVPYHAVVGLGLGSYSFLIHKNKKVQKEEYEIKSVTFVLGGQTTHGAAEEIFNGVVITQGTTFARDLVNEPPSVTTPTYLARIARSIVKKDSRMSCRVFGKQEMKKLGMNGILGISQGSHEEPKFVKLTYKGTSKKSITLIGKGITYDSGGLSLKPQAGLETMKCDMAGAATILGIFETLKTIHPECSVVGLIALCENMPGGGAIKPGDIIQALNGKTIEVVNTDAEGRIILADALSYADKYITSDSIIDLATLTGACIVALGENIAGLFTDNDQLAETLLRISGTVGEKLWRLPIAREYEDQLKSEVADVRNVSKVRYNGAINGALFLKEFAPKNVPWAHIDIAGPAFAESDMTISPYGGTGFGVQMLLRFIEGSGRKTRQ